MRWTYDATTDVAYLELRAIGPDERLGPNLLLEPDVSLHGIVIADLTADEGLIVGLEFVRASLCLPQEVLTAAERIDGQHLAQRLGARLRGRPAAAPAGLGRGMRLH